MNIIFICLVYQVYYLNPSYLQRFALKSFEKSVWKNILERWERQPPHSICRSGIFHFLILEQPALVAMALNLDKYILHLI